MGTMVCEGDEVMAGSDGFGIRAGVSVWLGVDAVLGEGVGEASKEALEVVTVYNPESPQAFKELLAYP